MNLLPDTADDPSLHPKFKLELGRIERRGTPPTDLHLDMVAGLANKRDPTETPSHQFDHILVRGKILLFGRSDDEAGWKGISQAFSDT